ncbi:MAG TPA: ATP-binding protein [Bryobacteraceae bacterium]|nr:ATP-binding protein [Bryobacteraceae bacterium]
MNRRSIRFRLTAWYAAIMAATLAAVGIGVWLAIRDSINDTVDKELRSRLAGMREFLQQETTGDDTPLDELIEHSALAPVGTRFRIADGEGRWLYQPPSTAAWGTAIPPGPLPPRGRTQTVIEKGKPIRILTATLSPGVVQIGAPIDEFAEMLEAFTWTALLASPVLLLLASAGGYWMSRRALAPVEQIARTAAEIETKNLSERLPVRGTGDELDHLSVTLNAMLGRLEDSFRRITQFTADASHELRTPIAIVRTKAEVVRRKPRREEEYTEALDLILAESERITQLIENLMLLARSDAHQEEAAWERVELAGLALSVYTEAEVLAQAAGIHLADFHPCEFAVSGDPNSLRRMILILLDNAIKYSHPGGEVQMVLGRCRLGDREMAVIEVKDQGKGIAAEDLPHVFERFYRGSKDRSRKIDGIGLGLSIARTITERHGGEIQIESELGIGSTARVWLPLA